MIKLITVGVFSFLALLFATDQDKEYVEVDIANNQDTVLLESINRGKIIYNEFCVRCHKETGKGHPKFYPPLAGSDWLVDKREESIRAVKYGLKGAIIVNGVTFKRNMANPGIENKEITDVMNYIMNSWGNTQTKMVTDKEVQSIEKQ